ncbi:MAG TPA: hypothetical protein VJR29_02305 [bacterium]|nr:hypothetical protein [bacterium]
MKKTIYPFLIAALALSTAALAAGEAGKAGETKAPMSVQEATDACKNKGKTGAELQACIDKKTAQAPQGSGDLPASAPAPKGGGY